MTGIRVTGEAAYVPERVTDEEWPFILRYLLLSKDKSASCKYSLRAVFDAYRYLQRARRRCR